VELVEVEAGRTSLKQIDEGLFEVTRYIMRWPIKSYVKVSRKGERVTVYSWETAVYNARAYRSVDGYLASVRAALRRMGLTDEQVTTVLEEVRRRLKR